MCPARQATPRKQKLVIKIPASASCITHNIPRILPPAEPANPVRAPRPAAVRGGSPQCSPRFHHPRFDTPATPRFILENFRQFLTSLEEEEISNYREIYYIRTREPADRESNSVTPSHFQFVTNEHIAFRFQMQKVLGKGAFGGVLKCIDHKTGGEVAIKMLRDHPKHHDQITLEFDFLNALQSNQNSTVIRLIETFTFHGFFCFVLELGTLDLYQTLRAQNFAAFSMAVVQTVCRRTAEALVYIHSHSIIHCDVKPENILFMDGQMSSVRLIDFGCSAALGDQIYTYIQSRFYRAPEIVIGVEYGPQIDVWSLGCVICEMVTGRPLFEAEDETELMQMFLKVLGMPPKWMVQQGKRAEYYFKTNGTPMVIANSDGRTHRPCSSSLADETGINDPVLLDLVGRSLAWDPADRLTPEGVIQHPWLKRRFRNPRRKTA
jgi:dual specificity tyrosine-phosphorylation-regulated kinase 2/3/4